MKNKLVSICTYAAEEDFSSVTKIIYLESRIDVNISIINDESIEGNETFTIYLTSDVGVNLSPYVQTEVTIIDDNDKEDDEDDNSDDGDDDENNNDEGNLYLDSLLRSEELIDTIFFLYTVTSTECDVNPCVNGGSCTQHGDNVTCTCPVGYTGDMCEGIHGVHMGFFLYILSKIPVSVLCM